MNFKDPFADDLKHFKATTSTLGSGGGSMPPNMGGGRMNADLMFGGDRSSHRQAATTFGGGGGGGGAGMTGLTTASILSPTSMTAPSRSQQAQPPLASQNAMSEAEVPFWGAPQQTFTMGGGGAAAAAPGRGASFPGSGGAGRRGGPVGGLAAATTTTAAAGGGGGGLGSVSGAGRRGGGGSVSWLNVGSDAPSRSDVSGLGGGVGGGGGGAGGMGQTMPTAGNQNQPSRASDDFLSFLDPTPAPAAATIAGPSAPSAAQSAAPLQQAPVIGEDPAIVAQRAEQARREKEVRDLYVTLKALELEEHTLAAKLDTKTIEEEAAITNLQTTIIEKTTELEEKMSEKEAKLKEVQASRDKREKELDERHVKEMAALLEELKAAERSRYEKQLQKLQSEYDNTYQHVTELRAQRALLIQQEPFSEHGITLQLSAMLEEKRQTSSRSQEDSVSNNSAKDGEKYDDDFESAASSGVGEGEGERRGAAADSSAAPAITAVPSSQQVEDTLEAAAAVLKAYCDARLGRARDGVVDYIHDETMSVAQEVRLAQLQRYHEETMRRKAQASAFTQQHMEAYTAFCRDRAARKQQRTAALHDEMEKGAALFREQAKRRLQSLLAEVTGKLEAITDVFEAHARENNVLLQRKAAATREGDAAMAAAQCAEVRHRCQTESALRQRLFQSQRESLQDQLTRIRHQGDGVSKEKMTTLYSQAATSSAAVAALREQLVVLQSRIEEELRQAGRRVAAGSGPGAPPTLVERRMDVEEAEHALSTLLHEAQRLQEELRLSRQRQEGALAALMGYLDEDLVGASVAQRLAHRRAQARLDHLRVAWEREHLQHLCSPHALEVLASGTDGPRAVTELQVHTDPHGAAVTALLDLLAEQVRARDAGQQALRQRREGQRTQYHTDVATLQAKYEDLLRESAAVATAALRLDEGREGLLTARTQAAAEAAGRELQQDAVAEEQARLARQRAQLAEARARLAEEAERAKASYHRQRTHLRQLLEGHRPTAAAPPPLPPPPTVAEPPAAAPTTAAPAAAAMGSLSPLTVATPSSGKGAAVTTPMTSPPPPGGPRARTRSPLGPAKRPLQRRPPYHEGEDDHDKGEYEEDDDDYYEDTFPTQDYRETSAASALRTPTPFTELLSMLDSSSGSMRTSA